MNINTISASRFTTLVAAGFFLAMPCAKAATTVATADQDFMLAVAQGGMDAKEFKAESASTTDVDIKSFVDKSLPVVQSHLEHIQAIKK